MRPPSALLPLSLLFAAVGCPTSGRHGPEASGASSGSIASVSTGANSTPSPRSASIAALPPEALSEAQDLRDVAGAVGFWVGSDQHPPRRRLDVAAFSIGAREVSQRLYQSVMGGNPSIRKGAAHPVENVSWDEAAAFCNAVSDLCKLERAYEPGGVVNLAKSGYRLPTSAEWERACRGDARTRFFWGEDFSERFAVPPITKAAFKDLNEASDSRCVETGTREPSPLGLYDMSGNVSEWCTDALEEQPEMRIVRGGSWANFDTVAFESRWSTSLPQSDRLPSVGFRLARSRR